MDLCLNSIQHVADLKGREVRVIQKVDEFVERLFEEDVVFPERVVGFEDEVLAMCSRVRLEGTEHGFE